MLLVFTVQYIIILIKNFSNFKYVLLFWVGVKFQNIPCPIRILQIVYTTVTQLSFTIVSLYNLLGAISVWRKYTQTSVQLCRVRIWGLLLYILINLKNNTVQNAWYDTQLTVSFLFTCIIYFKLLKYYWFTVVFILFILIFLSVSGESQPKAIL